MKLLYFCDEVALDIDNVLKPILDALTGVVFEDDGIVTDVEIRRRYRKQPFALDGASPVLIAGLELSREFVYVIFDEAPAQGELP